MTKVSPWLLTPVAELSRIAGCTGALADSSGYILRTRGPILAVGPVAIIAYNTKSFDSKKQHRMKYDISRSDTIHGKPRDN